MPGGAVVFEPTGGRSLLLASGTSPDDRARLMLPRQFWPAMARALAPISAGSASTAGAAAMYVLPRELLAGACEGVGARAPLPVAAGTAARSACSAACCCDCDNLRFCSVSGRRTGASLVGVNQLP